MIMMITQSINRPAITTFLSWLVLKEAFGIVEIGKEMLMLYLKASQILTNACLFLLSLNFRFNIPSVIFFHPVNLLLTISGIVLVVQPPFLFGTGNTQVMIMIMILIMMVPLQYTQHMTWTALGLLGVNILAGGTTVIIRHMKRVHWATQVSNNYYDFDG